MSHSRHTQPHCFHCGLPLQNTPQPPSLTVSGDERFFCCHGCQAVCETIVNAGLQDYYQHRSISDLSQQAAALPELLEQLKIYDREDVQRSFVHHCDQWREASLLLEDIRCPACLWLNERHLRQQPGVLEVHMDAATQRLRVRWDPQQIQLSEILHSLSAIGYIAHPYDASRSDQLHRARKRRSLQRLLYAGILGMMVMQFSISAYLFGQADAAGHLPLWIIVGRWTSLFVTTTLLAYPGQDFFIGAWQDFRNRRLGMDIPIVIGMSAAWLGSVYATLMQSGEVYFDSIAMFIFFLLLARHWETEARLQAADHLDRLALAVPQFAYCLNSRQQWQKKAVMDITAGDKVRVLPGETLPVDGILLDGISEFDESVLTGESRPVVHHPGEAVIAGSVNGEQMIIIEVSRAGNATTINDIQRLVDQGLEQKPHSALLADLAARWFVRLILLIGFLTAGLWLYFDPQQWLSNTIAVLIVTCPCALALATPVALIIASGRFVELGVLPLNMSALEPLANASLAAFDKTGTLTQGQPRLHKVLLFGDQNKKQCLHYAALLAASSEHPLAKAILREVADAPVQGVLQQASNHPGAGIEGVVDGHKWRLGKADFCTQHAQKFMQVEEDSYSQVHLAREGQVQAIFLFTDPMRTGLHSLVHDLHSLQVSPCVILSGDHSRAVRKLAQELHFDDYHSRLTPAEKLHWIQQQQKLSKRIIMLGDGINDAPTLAAADVSLSLADASDMATASSDFLLLNNDPAQLPASIQLARDTQRNIRQNLSWAAAYNIVAIPLAALGFIPPWGAALGMSASSLLVVLNASRLRKKRADNG
ncbi:MAG: cadmium-translocating P-type ATPase [gamma proteobacterium symbiont of Bathyaustriella thionipta]|nr:cadmium-translocating P-type ATPase [gamma proteobacterium symbiont of Bathyaustriella thionipta]